MKTIPFDRSPAWATLGVGLSLGARFWTATWARWLLAVVAVGLADGLTAWLFGPTEADRQAVTQLLLAGPNAVDPSVVPRLLAAPLAVGAVSLVAGWFLTANAVAGLRGREVTAGWVVAAGLRILATLFAAWLLLALVITVLTPLGPLGLLVTLAGVVLLVYLAIRLAFWPFGVFDGLGVRAAARASWAYTRGGILRVIGWSLALFGLSLLLVVATTVGSLPFGAVPVIPAVLGSLVSTGFQAFSVIVMAILYESQRLRFAATSGLAAGSPPASSTAPPPAPPSAPGGPPPPPPADPWRG